MKKANPAHLHVAASPDVYAEAGHPAPGVAGEAGQLPPPPFRSMHFRLWKGATVTEWTRLVDEPGDLPNEFKAGRRYAPLFHEED